jgi:hypothetical protein
MTDEDKQEILKAIEGMRQQNTAQHDEQLSILRLLKELVAWLRSWANRLHK